MKVRQTLKSSNLSDLLVLKEERGEHTDYKNSAKKRLSFSFPGMTSM